MENVPPSALPEKAERFASELTRLLGDPGGARFVRSSAGHLAVIVDHCEVVDRDELVVEFEDRNDRGQSLALVVADRAIGESDFDPTIDELADLARLVAIPAGGAPAAEEEYLRVGRVEQRIDDSLASRYVVLRRVRSIRERLLRGAPTDIGESVDNLAGRESWFKKRHSRDDR